MISDDTKRQLVLEDIDPLQYNEFKVSKRDGRTASFEPERIRVAIERAFKAETEVEDADSLDVDLQDEVAKTMANVVQDVVARAVRGDQLEIELIQDSVETQLMRGGHYAVARRYIVYRENHKRARALRGEGDVRDGEKEQMFITLPDGSKEVLDAQKIRRTMLKACVGYEDICSWQELSDEVMRQVYNGIKLEEIETALMLSARSRQEQDPAYGFCSRAVVVA